MITLDIKLDGLDRSRRDLRRIPVAAQESIEDVATDITLKTHQHAVQGVQRGPKSGRVYDLAKPTRRHQASAPGEYPATDLGRFAASIRFELGSSTSRPWVVGTADKRGPWFEFGTSRMGARPWLLRSFRRAVDGTDTALKAAFERRVT